MKKIKAFSWLLAGLMIAGPLWALDRQVVVVNNTSYDIVEFYGSNVGTENWEEDILGVDVLHPGERVRINFDDGSGYCKFDFLVIYSDGDEDVEEDFNVCEYGTLEISD